MIKVAGNFIDNSSFIGYAEDSIQNKVLNILISSRVLYEYFSMGQLRFELDFRSNIVKTAYHLNSSSFSFTTFRNSKCNTQFWDKTNEGGFKLKATANSYDAIQDIFNNSSMYGTECSTAIVIIFYKALLDILPKRLFNNLFENIYLMNWTNLDKDLGLADYKGLSDYLPGDCRYFKNPDVNPLTPEWQGENSIYLGDGMYYGHGIGVVTAEDIIVALNDNRISGADESAFLLDSALRPNFKYLSNQYNYYQNYI